MNPDSDEPIQDSDMNKMVTKFTLMCPGISLSTLTPGLSLHSSLSFEEICNQLTTTIEFNDDPNYSDVEVSDNKLVRRSIDNAQYSFPSGNWYSRRQVYIPSIEMETDLVGDTEMISTFIDRYRLNVNWVPWWNNANLTEDIAVSPFKCDSRDGLSYSNYRYQCVPPHQHIPQYIWTRYPQEISELAL